MEELTANVNWTAVIAGSIVSFLLGALWYSPKLFGEKWADGVGVSLGDASGMPKSAMVFQACGTFLLAWVVGLTAASNELLTIILILVTILMLHISSSIFCQKSAYAIRTEVGFIVVMAIIMIACQGLL